jgi:modulator of FtsH protease
MMLAPSSDFFVATAGAAAALAGLIIVAMTVSVDRIITIPGMTSRAATAIGLLVAATVISLAGLIDQPAWAFGIEALVAALAATALSIDSVVRVVSGRGATTLGGAVFKTGIGVVPAVLFGVGAVVVLGGMPGATVWIGIGSLFAIIVAVLNAWVLLVEIKR